MSDEKTQAEPVPTTDAAEAPATDAQSTDGTVTPSDRYMPKGPAKDEIETKDRYMPAPPVLGLDSK
ncbi:hypothetical protein [Streptomyces phaeofaciens]|uniref:hypothetical protein n=1 Tax=Streptomyces phaeofaciens TaxID=68254 RepID=UPI0036B803A3